jgi:hypothetical protein
VTEEPGAWHRFLRWVGLEQGPGSGESPEEFRRRQDAGSGVHDAGGPNGGPGNDGCGDGGAGD